MNESELRHILRKMRIHNVYLRDINDLPRVLQMLERRYRNIKSMNTFKERVRAMRSRAIKEYYF